MGFQELCLLCYETLGVRHSEAARVTLTSYVDLRVFRMLLRWKFSNLNFESKKVYRTLLHPPAVNLQYFLCIITQFKGCYKVVQPTLVDCNLAHIKMDQSKSGGGQHVGDPQSSSGIGSPNPYSCSDV